MRAPDRQGAHRSPFPALGGGSSQQGQRFFTHLCTPEHLAADVFAKTGTIPAVRGRRHMLTERHWPGQTVPPSRSIGNPAAVSARPPLRRSGVVQAGRFPAGEITRGFPPSSKRNWWPFQLHLHQQRISGDWRRAPEHAASCCRRLWMGRLSHGQHGS